MTKIQLGSTGITIEKNGFGCLPIQRVTKEEALDLPEQTFENRCIALSKKERSIYDRLRRDSFAELDGGGTITATTGITITTTPHRGTSGRSLTAWLCPGQ